MPVALDPRVRRLKSVMQHRSLTEYNVANRDSILNGSTLNTGARPNVLKIPRVLVYKGGRARAGNLKEIAFESSQQSDISLLMHAAMQREFRGNPALYKDTRSIGIGRGSVYQSGLRNISNENFKKKTKKRLLDLI
jgi:hypothetical protein